jgi:Flp pilus assembly protein TadD
MQEAGTQMAEGWTRCEPNPNQLPAIQPDAELLSGHWTSAEAKLERGFSSSMRSVPCLLVVSLLLVVTPGRSQDKHLPLPKRSSYTPVQKLNHDGVKALEKHNLSKAKQLFYQAYLIDPNDPFTLNNLGYAAELEGDLDRAQRYYDQAAVNTSEALVDRATDKEFEGKIVAKVAGKTGQSNMQVNQLNRQAVQLLNHDRAPEADLVLQQALKLDPKNAFTLNNMGFAKEKEGELEEAIQFYMRASGTRSREPVVVTSKDDWRGKPISEIAQQNAVKTQHNLVHNDDVEAQVARLNLRGVSAMNRNDRKTARQDFQKAYKLDPNYSFTINNMGFLAELDGDKETAQTYYKQAQSADRARAKVGVATRAESEGQPLRTVAEQSTALMTSTLEAQVETKRQSSAPLTLKTRNNKPVVEKPKKPAAPTDQPEKKQ